MPFPVQPAQTDPEDGWVGGSCRANIRDSGESNLGGAWHSVGGPSRRTGRRPKQRGQPKQRTAQEARLRGRGSVESDVQRRGRGTSLRGAGASFRGSRLRSSSQSSAGCSLVCTGDAQGSGRQRRAKAEDASSARQLQGGRWEPPRGLRRNPPCPHLDRGLPASRLGLCYTAGKCMTEKGQPGRCRGLGAGCRVMSPGGTRGARAAAPSDMQTGQAGRSRWRLQEPSSLRPRDCLLPLGFSPGGPPGGGGGCRDPTLRAVCVPSRRPWGQISPKKEKPCKGTMRHSCSHCVCSLGYKCLGSRAGRAVGPRSLSLRVPAHAALAQTAPRLNSFQPSWATGFSQQKNHER